MELNKRKSRSFSVSFLLLPCRTLGREERLGPGPDGVHSWVGRSRVRDPGNDGRGPVFAPAQERRSLKVHCASARMRRMHSTGRLAAKWTPA